MGQDKDSLVSERVGELKKIIPSDAKAISHH